MSKSIIESKQAGKQIETKRMPDGTIVIIETHQKIKRLNPPKSKQVKDKSKNKKRNGGLF